MVLSLQTTLIFVIAAIAFGSSLIVIFKSPRSIIHQSFFLFLLGVSLAVLGFGFLSAHAPFAIFDKPIHYGGQLFLLGLLIFAQVFPGGKKFPWKNWPLYVPFFFWMSVAPFNLIIRSATFNSAGDVVPLNGPLFIPYMLCLIFYFCLATYILVKKYTHAVGREKNQLRYIFTGVSIMLVCLGIFNVILPAFGIAFLYPIGTLSSLAVIIMTAYAILKHELLDIRIVIQRGIVYTVLLASIAITYFTGLALAGYFLHNITQISIIVAAGITTTIGVFFIKPLENYFKKVTDSIFFKDNYDYAETLHSLSNILYTSLNKKEILERSREILKNTFKTEDVHFVLDPEAIFSISSREQSAGFATLAQPIVFEKNILGILRLGKKRSGDSYTKQDLKLVETFVFQAATALVKAELHTQVQAYSTHLEQLVDERTKEIKKLQEDQRQSMIDISHNLQTPLAIIRGEVELLGEHAIEADRMRAVRKSLDRVSGFIRQLLHLSRLEHSLYTVSLDPIDLGALLEEQADYFEVIAEDKNAHITKDIAPDVYILGNKRLLEELFTNLVANALTYREKKRRSVIKIILSANETEARVEICDNGIGIAESDLENIFTRFYRAQSHASSLTGTGLGLAIAQRIVETHNGEIRVKSTVGKGTTFSIIFPRTSAEGLK